MKQLYLLRHAKSDWNHADLADFDRPLNARGCKAAQRMARFLREHRIVPAMVLCSEAKRTRQTLRWLEPAIGGVPAAFDKRIYEAAARTLLSCLRDLPSGLPSVLLIGHNPGIEQLLRLLAGDNGTPEALARVAEKYPTCGLSMLTSGAEDWRSLGPATCRLDRFVRPADLDH